MVFINTSFFTLLVNDRPLNLKIIITNRIKAPQIRRCIFRKTNNMRISYSILTPQGNITAKNKAHSVPFISIFFP